jgi:hypothetical protein
MFSPGFCGFGALLRGFCMDAVPGFPTSEFRPGHPPKYHSQQGAEQHPHDHGPAPEIPLFAVVILPALARQQVKSRALFGLFAKEHDGKLPSLFRLHKPTRGLIAGLAWSVAGC